VTNILDICAWHFAFHFEDGAKLKKQLEAFILLKAPNFHVTSS